MGTCTSKIYPEHRKNATSKTIFESEEEYYDTQMYKQRKVYFATDLDS